MVGAIIALLKVYQLLIVVRAVLSWTTADARHPVVDLVIRLTEPALRPFRPFARLGNMDLSPVVVIVLVEIVVRLIAR